MGEFTIKDRRIEYEDNGQYTGVTPRYDIGKFDVNGFFNRLDTYPVEKVLLFLNQAMNYYRTYIDRFKPKGEIEAGVRRTLRLFETVYREVKKPQPTKKTD
jgi:hypothetical protein